MSNPFEDFIKELPADDIENFSPETRAERALAGLRFIIAHGVMHAAIGLEPPGLIEVRMSAYIAALQVVLTDWEYEFFRTEAESLSEEVMEIRRNPKKAYDFVDKYGKTPPFV